MRIRLSWAAMPAGVCSGRAVMLWRERDEGTTSRGMCSSPVSSHHHLDPDHLEVVSSTRSTHLCSQVSFRGWDHKLRVTTKPRIRLPVSLVPSHALPARQKTIRVDLFLDSEQLEKSEVVRKGSRWVERWDSLLRSWQRPRRSRCDFRRPS